MRSDFLLANLILIMLTFLNDSNMMTIDITNILTPTLQSRVRVADLKEYIINSQVDDVVLDFKNVVFATRSFMDEFYRVFLKDSSNNAFKVRVVNLPNDINSMLESVTKTQNGVPTVKATANVTVFKNIAEAERFLKTASF